MRISDVEQLLAQKRVELGDVEVIYCLHSDYARLEANDIGPVQAWHVPGRDMVSRGAYEVRGCRTKEQATFLCFPGN